MKSWRKDIKTLDVFQQDLHAYADNLIYDVRLRMDVEDRIAEKFF